jgi:hypothetical protein
MLLSKVFVYRNLHKNTFSIKCLDTKRVIGYANELTIHAPVFKVSEASRQRVIRTKQKNVHAGVKGVLLLLECIIPPSAEEITYNPYIYDAFVWKETKEPIKELDIVYLKDTKIYGVKKKHLDCLTKT